MLLTQAAQEKCNRLAIGLNVHCVFIESASAYALSTLSLARVESALSKTMATAGDAHNLHSICALLTPFSDRQRNMLQQLVDRPIP